MFKRRNPVDNAPKRRSESQTKTPEFGQNEPRSSFRRNQTLTGSSSARINSTNELGATIMSPRAHIHHLSRRRKHLFIKLIGVVIGLLVTYLLVSQTIASTSVYIKKGEVDAGLVASYKNLAERYLEGRILERYYPTLNHRELLEYMQEKSPEISSVDVSLTGEFGKAQTGITLRKPVARWVVNGRSQFVDEEGIVFTHNAYKNPGVVIEDKNAVKNVETVASHRFLGFVGQVVGALKREGYKVTKISIPLLTTRQLEVKVKKVPYEIKMTIDRTAGEQAEDAARVIQYLEKKSTRPGYVDVRVEGKAFYK